ncbi:MAG: aminotransferase class V-fold PLP-dependent enzyme, partial [Bacteroidales bacterium]|nr:aminotransferase class V-fold PLP-dependent enzyme [Bacteroidales bacterium]
MNYKSDFPIFENRPDLIYFDNGASSQKPQAVIDAVSKFYEESNSNIHRGPHFLAEEATIMYKNTRRTVADFIGAQKPEEIIFTKNATEAINLVARTYGEMLNEHDVVVLSRLEHHANIVPWLQLKERKGIELRFLDLTDDGNIYLNT